MVVGRRFELHRDFDVSGVSGTGVVADGVQFREAEVIRWPDGRVDLLPAGWVRLTWRGEYASTVVWKSPEEAVAVHGHDGATRLVWLDDLDAGGSLPPGAATVVNNTGRPEPILTAEQWRTTE